MMTLRPRSIWSMIYLAALSGSMAFMLPVATPPNAIVFSTGNLRVVDMARAGLFLNIVGAIIITLLAYILGIWIFDINVNELPLWAINGD